MTIVGVGLGGFYKTGAGRFVTWPTQWIKTGAFAQDLTLLKTKNASLFCLLLRLAVVENK
jgi:hypothetical protein